MHSFRRVPPAALMKNRALTHPPVNTTTIGFVLYRARQLYNILYARYDNFYYRLVVSDLEIIFKPFLVIIFSCFNV